MKRKILKKVSIALVSFIISSTIISNNFVPTNDSIHEKNFVLLLLTILIYTLFDKFLHFKDKKRQITIICTSAFLTFLQLLSIHIITYNKEVYFYISKSIEWFSIFYILTYFIFNLIEKLKLNKKCEKPLVIRNKKIDSIYIFFFINLVIWITYMLRYYPGMTNYDVNEQIKQVLGVIPLNNWHPIFHTFIIKICLMFGYSIFNSLNVGIFIYNLFQFMLFDIVATYLIYYLKKIGINRYVIWGIMAFIILNPIYSLFSLYVTKDGIFSIMFLLDIIILLKLIVERNDFLTTKNVLLSFISIIITCFLRHNGMYIFILFIPFLYYLIPNKKLKITIFWLLVIITLKIYEGPFMQYFKIPKSSSREMLSIPVQGIARIVKYSNESLTKDEISGISKYFKYEEISNKYDEKLSDPIKDILIEENLKSDMFGFVKLYFKLLFKYPKNCFEAFIRNTSGYWSLEKNKLIFPREIYNNDFGIYMKKIWDNSFLSEIDWLCEKNDIPIISLVFSEGFCIWMLIIALAYLIYNKEYRKSILFLPIIFLYLTIIAGPVNGEFRYFYPIYICIPALCSILFYTEN